MFRYTQGHFVLGKVNLTLSGVLLTIAFSLILGFLIPAILPGAHAWHKGYNLFNGGLAVGMLGFFLFNFFYRTMGFHSHGSVTRTMLSTPYLITPMALLPTCFYVRFRSVSGCGMVS